MIEESKENIQIIKKNIKRLRELNGLTMRQISTILGVKENSYRIWEDPNGSCPKPHYIIELAKVFNVTPNELMLEENSYSGGYAVNSHKDAYSHDIYGDNHLTELSNSEKIILMSLRRLSSQDKGKVSQYIAELLQNSNTLY